MKRVVHGEGAEVGPNSAPCGQLRCFERPVFFPHVAGSMVCTVLSDGFRRAQLQPLQGLYI